MRDSNIDKCYPLDHSSRRAGSYARAYKTSLQVTYLSAICIGIFYKY